jgi:glycosyltransferase involved in cell wall biosynthesis
MGPARPRVSAIVTVRNGERYLGDALASILAQTERPWEILVVDGQSTDGSARIARSCPGVRYVPQPDLGLAAARNLGVGLARGDLVAFLDHDDRWARDKLRRQIDWMAADPSIRYTTTLMTFIVETGAPPRPAILRTLPQTPREGSTPSALVTERALFAAVGGFDPAYAIGCDADWLTRVRDLGVPTACVPEVLLFKRLHASNLSIDAAGNARDMLRIARASVTRRRSPGHVEDPARSR